MKKYLQLLVAPLLFANIASCSTETTKTKCLNNEYVQEFMAGLACGTAAGVSVEFLRNYVLPDITSWNLYGKYGICRDQLTGEAKVALALLLASTCPHHTSGDLKRLGVRLLGVFAGLCTSSFATTKLAQ